MMATAQTWSELLPYCTAEEMAFLRKVAASDKTLWRPLPGPQQMAYESKADITGYGGAAGGGKTDLISGLALVKHRRCLVVRREKAQTEGIVQRITEIIGSTDGYNSQKSIWKTDRGLIEFAGLDNPGDERRWQGRPHDLKAFDEVTEMREGQVRFMMGWIRSSDPDVHCRALMAFNPPTTAEGRWVLKFFAPWLDEAHPNPAKPGELRYFTTIKGEDVELPDGRRFVLLNDEPFYDYDPDEYSSEQIIKPKSRTFIPARVTDNPFYMATDYMAQLQSLPEPLRSQMLYGDFKAGIEDDPWQVIPTAWVDAAMKRWKPRERKERMDALGVDVARGGKDKTIISRRHDNWFDELLAYPGTQTPDGPTVAGLTIAATRNGAWQHIDVIGVGSSPYDFLNKAHQNVLAVDVRVSVTQTDQSGVLTFMNLRSYLWWRMRELLDPSNNHGIELPPDQQLLADLTCAKWEASGKVIKVESREEIIKRLGRSPDYASAVMLASMDTPTPELTAGVRAGARKDYDPYAKLKRSR